MTRREEGGVGGAPLLNSLRRQRERRRGIVPRRVNDLRSRCQARLVFLLLLAAKVLGPPARLLLLQPQLALFDPPPAIDGVRGAIRLEVPRLSHQHVDEREPAVCDVLGVAPPRRVDPHAPEPHGALGVAADLDESRDALDRDFGALPDVELLEVRDEGGEVDEELIRHARRREDEGAKTTLHPGEAREEVLVRDEGRAEVERDEVRRVAAKDGERGVAFVDADLRLGREVLHRRVLELGHVKDGGRIFLKVVVDVAVIGRELERGEERRGGVTGEVEDAEVGEQLEGQERGERIVDNK